MKAFETVLHEIKLEYDLKLKDMSRDFGQRLKEMEESIWSESELMAYDLGFAKAMLIVLDILKEQGSEQDV